MLVTHTGGGIGSLSTRSLTVGEYPVPSTIEELPEAAGLLLGQSGPGAANPCFLPLAHHLVHHQHHLVKVELNARSILVKELTGRTPIFWRDHVKYVDVN